MPSSLPRLIRDGSGCRGEVEPGQWHVRSHFQVAEGLIERLVSLLPRVWPETADPETGSRNGCPPLGVAGPTASHARKPYSQLDDSGEPQPDIALLKPRVRSGVLELG